MTAPGDRIRFGLRAMTGLYMHTPEDSLATSAPLYLGRVDEAMEHAFRSVELFDALTPFCVRWPDTETLRAHPRYPELWRTMGM